MQIATVTIEGDHRTVRLPRGCNLPETVAVRCQGDAVILEPVKPANWPVNFFDEIRISDSAFQRLPQGSLPSVKKL